jgi:hypothetical protein
MSRVMQLVPGARNPYIIPENGIISEVFPNPSNTSTFFAPSPINLGARYNLTINDNPFMSNFYTLTLSLRDDFRYPKPLESIKVNSPVRRYDRVFSSFAGTPFIPGPRVYMTLVDEVIDINDYNTTEIYPIFITAVIPATSRIRYSNRFTVSSDGYLYCIQIYDTWDLPWPAGRPPNIGLTVIHNDKYIIGDEGYAAGIGGIGALISGLTMNGLWGKPSFTVMEKVKTHDTIRVDMDVDNPFFFARTWPIQILLVFLHNRGDTRGRSRVM